MGTALSALLGGILVGIVFAVLKMPLPAPPTLAGILGAVGMFLGYQFYPIKDWVLAFFHH